MTYEIPKTAHAHMGWTRHEHGGEMNERAEAPVLSEREWDIIVGALNEAVSYWKRVSYGYVEILPVDVDPDEFLAALEPRIKEAHTLMLKLDQRRAPEPTPDLTHRPGRPL